MTSLVTQNYNFREWEVWGDKMGNTKIRRGRFTLRKGRSPKKSRWGGAKWEIFEGGGAKLGKS